ncbi:MAG TPA: metallophosphoesterase [Candidatus Binataceae bacterium]|nr:metallophosphoesterase [Candidatus Binataceae bacterium]
MKIVSFGDVHMATRNLERMSEVLRDTDLIIMSGDLTNFGGTDDASKVLGDARRAMAQFARDPATVEGSIDGAGRVLALPGNLDQREVIPFLEQEGVALHGRGMVIDGLAIFGCGGSNITPFKTPTELTEEELTATLERGYREVEGRRPLLMVCHTPPFETKCDRLVNGTPVGSKAVRRFIEEIKPEVCITGHIHESAGVDTVDTTKVLNAGPFKGGGYIVVRHNGGKLDASLEFL